MRIVARRLLVLLAVFAVCVPMPMSAAGLNPADATPRDDLGQAVDAPASEGANDQLAAGSRPGSTVTGGGMADGAPSANGQPVATDRGYAEGVVLVAFRGNTTASERAGARRSVNAGSHRLVSPHAPGLERLTLPKGASVEAAIKALERHGAVRYAEPDYVVRADAIPNDTYVTTGTTWGLYGAGTDPANEYGSGAMSAWANGQFGSHEVAVGIIDTGIEVNHPDLKPNIWTNPFETAGNGVDDDGNGYVDDINGWDFYNNDASVYDSVGADYHGTHVAGTIGGAGGNGMGVAGVNWAVTMISAKFIQGVGFDSGAIAALDYLGDLKTRHGINIVATNNSWGGDEPATALQEAINRAGDKSILFVAAAGNNGRNIDVTPSYPAAYTCANRFDTGAPRGYDCIIAVAAIDSAGNLAGFSNYGSTRVDLGAPGVGVRSTYPSATFAYLDGTSMAAPHVTGSIALLAACQTAPTPSALRSTLLSTATATPSLVGVTVTGDRLDAAGMMSACSATPPPDAVLAVEPWYITEGSKVYTLWFSRSVTGLTTGDFTLTGTSTGWSVSSVTGSGVGPYEVTIGAASPGDGTVILTLKANSVSASGTNGPAAAVRAVALNVDLFAPSVSGAAATPSSITIRGGTAISANATDSSVVLGFDLELDGSGDWQGMGPTDGAFGETSESAMSMLGGAVAQVATGTDHTCALMTDGTVRCWGMNDVGQLGDGTTTRRTAPVKVLGVAGAVAIASGYAHSCAVLNTGSIRCWGWNAGGNLGNGAVSNLPVPNAVTVAGITDAIDVSAGYLHSCALRADGTAWCWGENEGRIGDGTTARRLAPTKVGGLTNVVGIGAGSNHTCAVRGDGTAWCWGGANGFALLGDGNQLGSAWKVQVSGISNAVAIAVSAGSLNNCALLADGTVKCWGENSYGGLGDGTTTRRPAPVTVTGIDTAVSISVGYEHSCAVLAEGTARCWGWNGIGQLGDNTNVNRVEPVDVLALTGAIQISANGAHTCAAIDTGELHCWGNNYSGQLGDGWTFDRYIRLWVTGMRGPLAPGGHAVCVRAYDASQAGVDCTSITVTADGSAPGAALGAPTSPNAAATLGFSLGFTEAVSGLTAGDLSLGGTASGCSLAITQRSGASYQVLVSGCGAGTVSVTLAAGSVVDASGNPGPSSAAVSSLVTIDRTAPSVGSPGLAPSSAPANSPAAVTGSSSDAGGVVGAEVQVDARGWLPLKPADGTFGGTSEALTGSVNQDLAAIAIASGSEFSCALVATGDVYCWGENGGGQLGDGTFVSRSGAGRVTGIDDATAIAAGGSHACALRANQTVQCWGTTVGLLDSNLGTSNLPLTIGNLSGVVAIAAGGMHDCAVLSGGGVRCWGYGGYGQIGDGSGNSTQAPLAVSAISTATAVTAGLYHSCARLSSGALRCWGNAIAGQLGDGVDGWGRQRQFTPVAVTGITTAVSVTAGFAHTCARLADGTARCWGANGQGQLGDGTQTLRLVPVAVSGLTGVVDLAVGGFASCAVLSNGTARCWGLNDSGQLGDGSTTTHNVPTAVNGLAGAIRIAPGTSANDMNVEASHACAVLTDGGVRCWGSAGAGQLGVEAAPVSLVPVAASGFGPALSSGGHQVCVRATDRPGNRSSGSACSTLTIAIDGAPPTASLTPPATPTKATTLTYGVTFNESVTGLTAGDFTRTGTATGCVVGAPSGSGASYTVAITSCSAGTVILQLKAGTVADAAANDGPASIVTAATVTIDRTAPTVGTPATQLRATSVSGTLIPIKVLWTSADAGGAGIARYELSRSTDGGTTWSVISTSITSLFYDTSTGTTGTRRFRVRAIDNAGNIGAWVTGSTFSPRIIQETASSVTYSGTWSKGTSSNYCGGNVRYHTTAGRSASYTFSGRSIAFATTRSSTRGAVKIYIDGVLQTTIDLYAATASYQRLVYAKSWSAKGTHTIKIVVVGTATRPRVDFDALAVLK